MYFTIDIDDRVTSVAYCLDQVCNGIENIHEWSVSVNAGGIIYGVYFNFNVKRKELEICNAPARGYDNSLFLEEIIDEINKVYGEGDEDDDEDF